MTNLNKINPTQKSYLADYMKEHPDLARNILPNCAQGRSTAIRLWNELANKLNAVGPPMKDAKLWRKVYADQKYQAKKKLSFNKAAKRKSGGGLYEEKQITHDEEKIIEASGLEEAVKSISDIKGERAFTLDVENIDEDELIYFSEDSYILPTGSKNRNNDEDKIEILNSSRETNVLSNYNSTLVHDDLIAIIELQKAINLKLDRLLNMKDRSLQMKEEEHEANMAIKKMELQIKQVELDILKSSIKIEP